MLSELGKAKSQHRKRRPRGLVFSARSNPGPVDDLPCITPEQFQNSCFPLSSTEGLQGQVFLVLRSNVILMVYQGVAVLSTFSTLETGHPLQMMLFYVF